MAAAGSAQRVGIFMQVGIQPPLHHVPSQLFSKMIPVDNEPGVAPTATSGRSAQQQKQQQLTQQQQWQAQQQCSLQQQLRRQTASQQPAAEDRAHGNIGGGSSTFGRRCPLVTEQLPFHSGIFHAPAACTDAAPGLDQSAALQFSPQLGLLDCTVPWPSWCSPEGPAIVQCFSPRAASLGVDIPIVVSSQTVPHI